MDLFDELSNLLKPDSIREISDYPLINNHRWYAENGTVYNEVDDECRIALLYNNGLLMLFTI